MIGNDDQKDNGTDEFVFVYNAQYLLDTVKSMKRREFIDLE